MTTDTTSEGTTPVTPVGLERVLQHKVESWFDDDVACHGFETVMRWRNSLPLVTSFDQAIFDGVD